MFPSPLGIFFISIATFAVHKLYQMGFPSPMGIFFISIRLDGDQCQSQKSVSVPFGDLFYFYIQ